MVVNTNFTFLSAHPDHYKMLPKISPSLYAVALLTLFSLLAQRSYASPFVAGNENPRSRRQLSMANAISSIPVGQLNAIFSGKGNSDNQQDIEPKCQTSEDVDQGVADSLTACWSQYKTSNGSAGLRCGGKGWYRGHDKNYQDSFCQETCWSCIDNAVEVGAKKVSCTFEVSADQKCWTGYH